jgi:uncharacterized protein (DUF433 family)
MEYNEGAAAGRQHPEKRGDTVAQAGEVYPGVVMDPQILHGKPVLAGTRVPVALVLGQMAGGVGFEELEREYGVTRAQAQVALAYAAQLVAPESVYAVAAE